jgi:hypothetical protein
MINHIATAMEGMSSRYYSILSKYYPAHGSTGFTERNLTHNFVSALEKTLGNECISWFEAPICLDNNKHIDAVIFYHDVTILIEAKRFTSVNSQVISVKSDIDRMHSQKSIKLLEKELIGEKIDRKRYSVVLADVWTETDIKQSVFDNWPSSISHDYVIEPIYHHSLEFKDLPIECNWKENYKILLAVHEIKI